MSTPAWNSPINNISKHRLNFQLTNPKRRTEKEQISTPGTRQETIYVTKDWIFQHRNPERRTEKE